jgi:hypothetical protein
MAPLASEKSSERNCGKADQRNPEYSVNPLNKRNPRLHNKQALRGLFVAGTSESRKADRP